MQDLGRLSINQITTREWWREDPDAVVATVVERFSPPAPPGRTPFGASGGDARRDRHPRRDAAISAPPALVLQHLEHRFIGHGPVDEG